jgi:DMSO/TMAO reductase YedYZ heme-binding membrane subunit
MKKGLLYAVAILLPLIPLVAWLASSWQDFGQPLGAAFFALYVPARALGLLGFVLMFYQFILASRLSFLESVLPRAKQLKTHRTLGKVGGIMMLTHGLFMLLVDWITLGAIAFTVGKLIGIVALFLLINAVVAAWFIRQLQFKQQTWRRIHYLAYIVFPLVFVHAILIGSTVRGYLAVQILFGIFLAIYVFLAVRRLVAPPNKPAKKAPAKPKPAPAPKAEPASAGPSAPGS